MSTRALALLAAVVALVLAVSVYIGAHIGGDQATTPAPAPSPVATATSYNPDATDAGDASEENDEGGGPPETQENAWAPAVDNFARNFTNTRGGAKQWRKRLIGNPQHPYVSTEVAEQLATVDVRKVPDGHYDSREIADSSEYELAVKVTYREGWAMILWLNTDGTAWTIYAYDRWEE